MMTPTSTPLRGARSGPIAFVLAGAMLLSCGRETAPSAAWRERALPGAAEGWNVLLITLDTTRRDRIGCYGYGAAETPAIDALAARGVRFEDAVTSAPLTLPSHATILTGLYPPSHGVRDNGRGTLPPDRETLAETLAGRGYATAAFVGAFVLDERFGLGQGFELYDFAVTAAGHRPRMPDFNERSADAVTDAALRWLEARGESPFFAWVHYFDPHLPYESPLAGEARFAGRGYDAEIAFVDSQIGRIVEALRRQGRLERTLIVVTADHGEAFGEHGEPTHGLFVYEATLRVPLVISNPALFDRAYVAADRIAGLVDVRPTIEDLLGLAGAGSASASSHAGTASGATGAPGPGGGGDGISLLRGDESPDRAIYVETLSSFYLAGWSPLAGLRTRGAKYVRAPEPEFYDLRADADEARNLYASGGKELERLRGEFERLAGAWSARGPATHAAGSGSAGADAREASDEEIERLRSLGYLGGGAATPNGGEDPVVSAAALSLPDPKRMVGVYTKWHEAEHVYEEGRFEDAARLAREVVDACPSCVSALRVLAFSLLRLERADEALALLRESSDRIHDTFLYRSLAQLLILRGDCDAAQSVLDAYEALDPADGRVPLLRGDCLAARKLWAEAAAQYERAGQLDPNRVGIIARERIVRMPKAGG